MNYCNALICIVFVPLLFAGSLLAENQDFVMRHEQVLGTSLELRVKETSAATASSMEEMALSEIDRLVKIFSRHDTTSELMRWQQAPNGALRPSSELIAVLQRAEHWRLQTGGAFDVRAAALMDLWNEAEKDQRSVSDLDRRSVVQRLAQSPYELLSPREVRRQESLPITLDALAKGYILDAVCEKLGANFRDVHDFSLMIGGDLRKIGKLPLPISITDPTNSAEGALPLGTISVDRPMALATSGNYRRYYEISGRQFSHIVDPRTGFPTGEVQSATVIAPSAMDADALATSLSVLAPHEGLALVESLADTSCLLILTDGRQVASRAWPKLENARPVKFVANEAEEEARTGLTVKFTLNRAQNGGPYRRPYVAIWLEDADGYPVKTALLWMLTDQPGPKWHRDLTRWYRNDRTRKELEKTDLIGTISGATRGPGAYEAHFDGTDNAGKPLPNGKYFLCLESAREHGKYQIIRTEIELQGEAIAQQELKESTEMSKVSYEYVPPASGPAAEEK